MSAVASQKHGPEVLLIFLGHSSDADTLADAIYGLERDLQRLLDQHLSVSAEIPFKSVRIWEWRKDGLPVVGGQDQVVADAIKRANIAVFVFKERIGTVSWDELNQSRNRVNPAIPVLAFFPTDSPPDLNDAGRIAKWLDLITKRDELVKDWNAPNSKALRPMEKYKDAAHLTTLAVEQLSNAVVSLLKCEPATKDTIPPEVFPAKFLGDHSHLSYDRQPVLTRSLDELDQDSLKELLAKPLSQDLNADLKKGRDGSNPAVSEQLENLGCLYAGRPTLGALLCFAPAQLLTDKSGCCTLQMAIHDGSERGGERAPLSLARGNLLLLYKKGMSWLTGGSVLRRRGQIGTDTRDDLEIPEIVLREALANALVHRDYESKLLQDQPTRIDVYPDKVEITSYGLLLKEVPIELLNSPNQSLRPFRRNPVIAGIFQCMTLAELNASGIQRMRRVMTSGGLALPLFRTSDNFVCVTLARPFELSNYRDPIQSALATSRNTRKAFISSTGELAEHRKAAQDACLRAGVMPIMWDQFPAAKAPVASLLNRMFDEADLCIFILGNRYGSIADPDGTSFTEMEFDLAVKRGLSILVFMIHRDHPITIDAVQTDPEGRKRLEEFKKRVAKTHLWAEFKSPDELRHRIIAALASLPALPPSEVAAPDKYLRELLEATSFVNIRGLSVGRGKAHRFPIEDLYITLKSRIGLHDSDEAAKGKRRGKKSGTADKKSKEPFERMIGESGEVPLQAALSERRLVVIGDPGTGKTTFLRRVAAALCATELGTVPQAAQSRLGINDKTFPIFLRCATLANHIAAHRGQPGVPTDPASPAWLAHCLAATSRENGTGLDQAFFQRQLEAGRCTVLLDGLDEAPDLAQREALSLLAENVSRVFADCRFVVTSRPPAYTGTTVLPQFAHVEIAPLSDDAVDAFLTHWCRTLYDGDTPAARDHCRELLESLHARPEIRRVARNPVMLTALAVVHWNERRMPEQRAEVYESVITWLCRSRENRPGREKPERTVTLLQELALALQNHPEGRQTQMPKRWAAEQLAPYFGPKKPTAKTIKAAEEFLTSEELDSGIIVASGSDIRFWQLQFQEFLAARAIAGRSEGEQRTLLSASAPKFYRPEWREVILLLAGALQRQGEAKVDRFVTQVLDSIGPSPNLAAEARCAGLLGAVFHDLKPVGYQPHEPRYDALLDRVMAIFDCDRSKSVKVEVRVAAAEALGQVGDPRLEHDAPQRWITIPAGTFRMGSQKTDKARPNFDEEMSENEGQVHDVTLDAFSIARFPVTVGEFQGFVEDDGYAKEKFWTVGGGFGQFTVPEEWSDQLEHCNRPVVGVSWFEAVAYCAWAGCRLPTEPEWERAARGTTGRRYPWGQEPADETRLNFNMNIGAPTPVGIYPLGATPEGLEDMAGNVWEWCIEFFDTPERNPVLRGGSWSDKPRDVRAAARGKPTRHHRHNNIGFRMVSCIRTSS